GRMRSRTDFSICLASSTRPCRCPVAGGRSIDGPYSDGARASTGVYVSGTGGACSTAASGSGATESASTESATTLSAITLSATTLSATTLSAGSFLPLAFTSPGALTSTGGGGGGASSSSPVANGSSRRICLHASTRLPQLLLRPPPALPRRGNQESSRACS